MRRILKKIDYSKRFNKQLKKAPLEIKKAFRDRLVLFSKDPSSPLLNNHPLSGKFKGYRSINITGDWRAIFREFDDENLVFFDALGTHSQLYR